MKNFIVKQLKIIILAVILFVGVNQALSWYAPTQLPPLGNTLSPIDTSSTSQVKGGTNNFGSMLHINGLLSSNLLKVNTFAGNGDKYVCVNNSGQLYVCGAPVVAIAPTVTTASPSGVSQAGAVGGGTITSDGGSTVTVSGLVWSTSPNPTTALSTKTTNGWATGGPWTSSITGLSPVTTYHVRAYATNSVGTSYGDDIPFTTSSVPAVAPTVITGSTSNITQRGATVGGTISSNGGGGVTASGIVWGISPNPTIALSTKTTDGWALGGPWTSSMTGLSPSTTYHVRAYATNSAGTAYGNQVTVRTLDPYNLTVKKPAFSGTITIDALAFRNYPMASGASVMDMPVSAGEVVTSTVTSEALDYRFNGWTGCDSATGYVCIVNVKNSTTIQANFTFIYIPTLTTATPTSITSTGAVGGGTITSDGGSPVTVSGLVWSTSPNPTTALSTKTTDGWALGGPWTSNITGLSPGTTYHVRAYATNKKGTSYGGDVVFTTPSAAPPKIIFATPPIYQGNFTDGDAICQATANANGLSGTYKWYGCDSKGTPDQRFTKSQGAYKNTAGVTLAPNYEGLYSPGFSTKLIIGADGVTTYTSTYDSSGNPQFWTGMNPSNNRTCSASYTCNNWTNNVAWGPYNGCTLGGWNAASFPNVDCYTTCSIKMSLTCVQQ